MNMSSQTLKIINLLKLIGVPILVISFFHPMAGVWSALSDVIMNSDVKGSSRTLVAVLYGTIFATLVFTAWKGLRVVGFLLFVIVVGAFTFWLYDTGKVSFDSAKSIGWLGVIVAILVGYVGVFGANIYRIVTGRLSADSDDADT